MTNEYDNVNEFDGADVFGDDIEIAVAVLSGAIERLPADAGEVFTPAANKAWRILYEKDTAQFERLRQLAKTAGARVAAIDREAKWVEREKPQQKSNEDFVGEATKWQNELVWVKTKNDERVLPSRSHNVMLILMNAPEYAGKIWWDSFDGKPMLGTSSLTDYDTSTIGAYLEKTWFAGNVPRDHVFSGIMLAAHSDERHPVREYLDKLEWDGIPRIATFFHTHLGTPDDIYHRDVAFSLFIGGVRRIQIPGCQLDTMTILQGQQGIGKTRTWQTLFSPWYAEVTESMTSKDFFVGLHGLWCADFGELDGFGKADTSRIKQILTIREDHYRAPYGRLSETHARQNIFVGGTNSDHFNSDSSGGRRFHPVRVSVHVDIAALAAARDQLWAEAVVLSKTMEKTWWQVTGSQEAQDAVYSSDSWESAVAPWLMGRADTGMTEVLSDCLGIELGQHSKSDQMRVGHIMRRLGWTRKRIPRQAQGVARGWRYYPPDIE
jgi:putative DNA primase/helicase